MKYKLTMKNMLSEHVEIFYDPYTSELTNQNGEYVVHKIEDKTFSVAVPISPESPGKKGEIGNLKIQLGLKCNYSCSYCSQAEHIGNAIDSNNSDAISFMANLDNWLHNVPKTIEFWGGEPFVYWSKIKILLPVLREKFPDSRFLIITNGTLLDDEKIEFIEKYDIMIGMSHDGPAQSFRGPDPFKNETNVATIRKLMALRPGKISFNMVLHSKNYDLNAIHDWFSTIVPNPALTIEGVVNVYDNYTQNNLGMFTKQQFVELTDNVFMELVTKNRFYSLNGKLQDFMNSLKYARPISALGQKCGMDRTDQIAVDLQGNVMTCQNTGSKGHHNIGHVNDYENIALNTSMHLSHREECMNCPVVQLCKGSCMYLFGDQFAQSCWNEYYFNLGIFKAALFKLTNMVLINVEGEIVRPEFTEAHMKKHPKLMDLYS